MAETAKKSVHKNFVTPVGRASYAHVWERAEMPNGDMKFSMAILIPKSDTAGIKSIKSAIVSAATDFFGADKKKWPKGMVNPLHNGDDKAESNEVYKDTFYLNTKSDRQPGIVGPDAKPLLDQNEFYSGCYCRVSVNFYGYNKAGNQGIGVGMNNVMKTKDGERLDGKKSAESEFGEFAVEVEEDSSSDTDESFLEE